uniref:Uncharacterized protein n=1 Tax=Palpitomonas bilix TaxID=652834 RepID=A0A7S3D9F9_9EUKA|mmetsp:Transcript_27255/g.70198  ORF Transcript_27255/g.70198 Transcript_27255/m.70198 type:complete len:248 (+) Transcript_27255:3-746(+)
MGGMNGGRYGLREAIARRNTVAHYAEQSQSSQPGSASSESRSRGRLGVQGVSSMSLREDDKEVDDGREREGEEGGEEREEEEPLRRRVFTFDTGPSSHEDTARLRWREGVTVGRPAESRGGPSSYVVGYRAGDNDSGSNSRHAKGTSTELTDLRGEWQARSASEGVMRMEERKRGERSGVRLEGEGSEVVTAAAAAPSLPSSYSPSTLTHHLHTATTVKRYQASTPRQSEASQSLLAPHLRGSEHNV